MMKKLLIIATLFGLEMSLIGVGPNTLVKCDPNQKDEKDKPDPDYDCKKYQEDQKEAGKNAPGNLLPCREYPGYKGPELKCKTEKLYGKEISYCRCEYTPIDKSKKDKKPKDKSKIDPYLFAEGMNRLKYCPTGQNDCNDVACTSGADPQCNGGICYCPF